MRRAMAVVLAGAMLAGCPSTMRNRPADASDERAGDVGEGSDADVVVAADGDAVDAGDVADVDVDQPDAAMVPDVEMRIDFVSVALQGAGDGGVTMRATMTWHGALRGSDDGGVSFNGGMR